MMRLPSDEFVEDGADRIDVGAHVWGIGGFRCQEVGVGGGEDAGIGGKGNAEIADFGFGFLVEEDVRGVERTMDDLVIVRMGETGADALD